MTTLDSIMRELIADMPQGGTMPALRFFEPKPKFISYMVSRFKGYGPVYDVGAGDGYTTQRLNDAGVNTNAIDLSFRAGMKYPVEIANAVDYAYLPDSCVMFCRPCHGPWVEVTIAHALRCGVSGFIYVGLSKNIDSDLGRFKNKFKRELSGAGKSRECVMAWKKPKPKA